MSPAQLPSESMTSESMTNVEPELRWLPMHLPDRLLAPGPGSLLIWQWLALPLIILLAWSLGYLLSRVSRRVLARLVARTAAQWDDALLARLGGPLTFAWTLVVTYLLLPRLDLRAPAELLVHRILGTGFFVGFFWALARSVDVVKQVMAESPWAKEHPGARALLPLGARVIRVLIFAIAVIAMLSELGYSVASLVAGLGIGGLALALAAQKTVENLFGTFSIGADQPFREGDFVRVEDLVGTVETIGLRSTRIRTLGRTIVSIPNGKLADMRLESFAPRDRIRLACTIGLIYGTTAAQMRTAILGIERVLREHPRIWPDTITVCFKALGESSLDIEVAAWFQTADWAEFLQIRQEVLLKLMEVVEHAGSSFAFPTRTVHVVREDGGAAAE